MFKVIDDFTGEYMFLSNFAKWPCEYEGIHYPTSEHAYQAAKTLDIEERRKIASMGTPRDAKHAGAKISLRFDWEEVKDGVMFLVLLDKFTRNKAVYDKLMATGDAELIEGNTWHDNHWGDCRCEKCHKTKGKNMLGRILMRLRKRFRTLECR
jgi:hypothetical protein